MKCPHCGKAIKKHRDTPEALLRHLNKTANDYKLRKRRIEELHGKDKAPDWMQEVIEKWQSWATWVEKKIKEEREEQNDRDTK